jgi:hypothetical protein
MYWHLYWTAPVGLGFGSVVRLNVPLLGDVEFVNVYGKVEPPGRSRAARNGVILLSIGGQRIRSAIVFLCLDGVVVGGSNREEKGTALEK